MMRHGTGLIGLLLAMVIMVVLSVVGLNALNQAVTGSGSVGSNTVRSFKDTQYLSSLFTSMVTASYLDDGDFIVPGATGRTDGRSDVSLNTTANLFSAMIAQQMTVPAQIVSGNEYNPNVWIDEHYDYTAYDPRSGTHWDPSFVADLDNRSNVSFAHVPLYGRRLRSVWKNTLDSRTPILGNRGPKDGVDDPESWTYGRNGQWAGHVVFGDGHVALFDTFTPPGLTFGHPERYQDNIFAMEDGPHGIDAVLAFTRLVTETGFELQWD